MTVRITQIDGSHPNLALMQIASYHRAHGHEVVFATDAVRSMYEPVYDCVYASAIFTTSQPKLELFLSNFPDAVVGGTWLFQNETGFQKLCAAYPAATLLPLEATVESYFGLPEYSLTAYDYSIYPEVDYSVAFTQRGCKLKCHFCCVGTKEGRNISLPQAVDYWLNLNPNNTKRKLLLQDNDFTNQPAFEQRCRELIEGDVRVCINQGINVRLIDFKTRRMKDEATNTITAPQARLLSQLNLRDKKFKRRRLYTAWDNSRDEKIFWQGIETLCTNGFKPAEILVYFLCNYWDKGLTDDVWYRFEKMRAYGLLPYPMIYEKWTADKDLKDFQEWVIQGRYHATDFSTFQSETKQQYKARKAGDQQQLF